MDQVSLIVAYHRDLDQPNEDQALNDDGSTPAKFLVQMEITYTLTTLYVLVEAGRWEDTLEDEPIIQQAFGIISSLKLELSLMLMIRSGHWIRFVNSSHSNTC